MANLTIPTKEWKKLQQLAVTEDLITEDQAAELLGVKVKTIRTYVFEGRIEPGMYTIGALGKRFYYKSKLMGK